MKILIAVDGSPYTKRMLAYLAAHDELLTGKHEFTAITVVPPVTPHARSYITRDVLDNYYNEVAKEVLDPVVAFAKQNGWSLTTLQPVGHIADAISETAKVGKFDLMVMGSHGHSSIGNMVLGSVVQRVLAQTSTPVLIVR